MFEEERGLFTLLSVHCSQLTAVTRRKGSFHSSSVLHFIDSTRRHSAKRLEKQSILKINRLQEKYPKISKTNKSTRPRPSGFFDQIDFLIAGIINNPVNTSS